MKISFIGGGNMANALIGGMLARGYAAQDIAVVEIDDEARARLAERFGVRCAASPGDALPGSAAIVLAVKPQQLRDAASAAGPLAGYRRRSTRPPRLRQEVPPTTRPRVAAEA